VVLLGTMNPLISVALLLVAACGGGSPKPETTTAPVATPSNSAPPAPSGCDRVGPPAGVSLVDAEDGALAEGDLAAERAAVGKAIAGSCARHSWSDATIACVEASSTIQMIAACVDQMTPPQQEDFQAVNREAGAPFEKNHE